MKAYPIKARIRDEGGITRIDLMDDIGQDFLGGGISAAAFTDSLSGLRGPLDVHISSAGGMVDQGLAIYNALASYPGPVTTYNDGLAASIASVIMQAGSKRVASPVSALMIHDAWGAATGNAADMESMRSALDKNSDIIARAYAQRAGGTVEQWREAMKATTWYDAEEALAAGLVDEIAGGASKPAAPVDLEAVAASAPARIMAALRSMPQAAAPDAPAGQKCKTCKGSGRLKHPGTGKNGMTCPGCKGSGVYDPDHDGDDDATAAGDTDHDYVEPDGSPGPKASARAAAGKPFEPEPYHRDPDETVECPVCHLFNDLDARFCDQCGAKLEGRDDVRVLPAPPAAGALSEERVRAILREEVAAAASRLRDAGPKVDDSPWDADKAWHNGAQAKDPEAFYRAICAGEKTDGDPGTQAHWALPYRYTPDSPPNAAAVRNCLARLPQTEGLKDPAAVKAGLHALMKQVNPDWEPEDSTETVFSQRLRQMRAALPALKGADA